MSKNNEKKAQQRTNVLTAKQQRALETLLVGGSDQQASEASGVVRLTIARWRTTDAGFMTALTTARSELLRRTSARIHAATSLAVRALEEVVKDTRNPAARIAAARAILDFSLKARQIEDLEVQLNELEQQILSDKAEAVAAPQW